MKRQLTHRAQQTHDSYHVRKLGVHANGAHAYVELQQDQDRPEQVSLDISGGCLDYAGVGPIGQVSWEVRGPEALRAVAEALLVLADRAEELGMLTALRTHRRASSTAITAGLITRFPQATAPRTSYFRSFPNRRCINSDTTRPSASAIGFDLRLLK